MPAEHALFSQLLLDVHDELIVDLFAGGGGASLGIEMATGRQVDVAVNHDLPAVELHRANHPQTRHLLSDVFEVDPRAVTQGRPVGLLWASPDCTDHSKAKGGKPIREKKRRALAWVVKRWAGQVAPRVIMLENVEEFADWGPLVGRPGRYRRSEKRKGRTFRRFVRQLEELGYRVEHRELRACDFGAPTTRKRLFLIARRDGRPVRWPEPTHGPAGSGLKPYRAAAECIDWSIPMCSIFATAEEARAWGRLHRQHAPKRPLRPATMRRIARGVVKYVLEAAEPFLVPMTHSNRPTGLEEPLQTITTQGNRFNLVAPYMVPRYGERDGQEPRTRSLQEPHPVIVPTGNGGSLVAAHLQRDFGQSVGSGPGEPLGTVTADGGGHAALVASFLAKHYGGVVGSPLPDPIGSVTTIDHHGLVGASLAKLRGTSTAEDPSAPLDTISAGGNHHAAVAAFLRSYYGTEVKGKPGEPLHTIPTVDRFGLVTVDLHGEPWVIVDIAMRMLQPRELFTAQGFDRRYRIQVRFFDPEKGKERRLTKTEQVRLVGNSVSPDVPAALVRVNCPELVARDEVLEGVA